MNRKKDYVSHPLEGKRITIHSQTDYVNARIISSTIPSLKYRKKMLIIEQKSCIMLYTKYSPSFFPVQQTFYSINQYTLKPFFYEYVTENDEHLHEGTYSEHNQCLYKLDRNHFNTLSGEINEMLLLFAEKSKERKLNAYPCSNLAPCLISSLNR